MQKTSLSRHGADKFLFGSVRWYNIPGPTLGGSTLHMRLMLHEISLAGVLIISVGVAQPVSTSTVFSSEFSSVWFIAGL
jgi:hypothetical protein